MILLQCKKHLLLSLMVAEQLMNQLKRRNTMPKVGNKKFSYSKKGKAAAKQEAKKSGKKVVSTKKSGGY